MKIGGRTTCLVCGEADVVVAVVTGEAAAPVARLEGRLVTDEELTAAEVVASWCAAHSRQAPGWQCLRDGLRLSWR